MRPYPCMRDFAIITQVNPVVHTLCFQIHSELQHVWEQPLRKQGAYLLKIRYYRRALPHPLHTKFADKRRKQNLDKLQKSGCHVTLFATSLAESGPIRTPAPNNQLLLASAAVTSDYLCLSPYSTGHPFHLKIFCMKESHG